MASIRIYALMAVLAGFEDEEPLEVNVSGTLSKTGVDESAFITLKYSDGRVGNATCCARVQLCNEAFIAGDDGIIKVLAPFWCGENVTVQKFKDTGLNAKEALPLGKLLLTWLKYKLDFSSRFYFSFSRCHIYLNRHFTKLFPIYQAFFLIFCGNHILKPCFPKNRFSQVLIKQIFFTPPKNPWLMKK